MGLIPLLFAFLFSLPAHAQEKNPLNECLNTHGLMQCETACYLGHAIACRYAIYNSDVSPQQSKFLKDKLAQITAMPVYAPSGPTSEQVAEKLFYFFISPLAFMFYIGGFITYLLIRRNNKRQEFYELPKEGPMQVNLTEGEVPLSGINRRIRFQLKVEVKISQKDWHSIQKAGLKKFVLVSSDGPTGDDSPDNVRHLQVEDLKNVCHLGFTNIQRLQEGKEQLVQSLRNLKAQIETHQQGPKQESFEI
jgi:hypothetical protein